MHNTQYITCLRRKLKLLKYKKVKNFLSTTIFREKFAEICSLISLKVLADWVSQSWQEEETKYGFYIITLNSIKTGYLYEYYLSFSVLKFLGMKSLSIFWNITTTLSNFIWFILVCVMFKICLNLLPRDIFWQFTIDTNVTFTFTSKEKSGF